MKNRDFTDDDVSILKQVYKDNDCPLDQVTIDQLAIEGFTREVNRRTQQQFSSDMVMRELYDLRKSKRRRGGLPRVGRRFNGPNFRA